MDHETIERDNVIEHYVAKKLEPAKEAMFEEHLLECERCAEQVEVADDLRVALGDIAREEASQALSRGFLVTLLASTRVRAGLAGAAFLVALLLPWFLQQRNVTRLAEDLQMARAEVETTRRALEVARGGDQEQLAALQQEIEASRTALEEAETRRLEGLENAKQERTTLLAQLATAMAPQANARIFSLSPFRDVGIGETPRHEISLPPGDAWIVLSLDAGGGEASAYRATLRRGDAVVWTSGDLAPDEIGSVVVSLPPGFLETGEYRLDVAETGGVVVARYPLRARGS